MAIVVKLEALMMKHHIALDDIAELMGVTNVNASRLKTGKAVSYRGTTIDALIKGLRQLGIEGCDVKDVLGFVEDDEVGNLDKGVYVSVPKELHCMSNPFSDATKKRLRNSNCDSESQGARRRQKDA